MNRTGMNVPLFRALTWRERLLFLTRDPWPRRALLAACVIAALCAGL